MEERRVYKFIFEDKKRRVYLLLSVAMAVLSVGMIVVALSAHRHAGPSFTFEPPGAITVVEGGEMVERKIKFPNFLPFQWSVSFSITPLFNKGDVIEIDLSLLEEGEVNEYSIRINGKPIDTKGKDVSFSYIFKLNCWNKLPENKEVIRIKIDSVSLDGPIAHHQKQKPSGDEWFWLREIYMVKLIG